ncbi:hypothetical protein FB451DRAFT_1176161 [Mycena latifolia]|nr:hypothetical protein FB451DRAFT_1176161 [Mycena latifolia]
MFPSFFSKAPARARASTSTSTGATTASANAMRDQNEDVARSQPAAHGDVVSDTDLVNTLFGICEARDSLNAELEGWYGLMEERLAALKDEEAAAGEAVEALKVSKRTLEFQSQCTTERIEFLHDKLREKLGPDRYYAWVSSHGLGTKVKATLPPALRGARGKEIKSQISVTKTINAGGSRARRVAIPMPHVLEGTDAERLE